MKLDALLKTEGALDEDEHSQFKQSDFNILKTDPGRTSLAFSREVQKLKRIRQIGLPLSLFSLVPPKIVHHYRRRASTEPPRELRRHPAAIRYT